jgi:hypothetical protein
MGRGIWAVQNQSEGTGSTWANVEMRKGSGPLVKAEPTSHCLLSEATP